MRASEIMCKEVACVTANDHANAAAQIMWECDCGIVPVVQVNGSKQLLGVITDRDICMAAYTQGKPLSEISVESAMASEVLTCRPDDSVAACEHVMREAKIRRLPVVDGANCLVGILSLADIARQAEREKLLPESAVFARQVGETLAGITLPHGVPATA